MNTLLKKGFNLQSGERIVEIGGRTTTLMKMDMMDIRMGRIRLVNSLVDKANNKIRARVYIYMYIWIVCKGQPGFQNYTKHRLTENINKYVNDVEKTIELIDDVCDDNTEIIGYNTDAMYCVDPVKVFQEKGDI